MLRFTNWTRGTPIRVCVNNADDECRCSEPASAGSRRACCSHHGPSGAVRSIFRSACGAFRPACGPCASTAFCATDCHAPRTGATCSKRSDRRSGYCCADRCIALRRTSKAWRKRQFTFVHPARDRGGVDQPSWSSGVDLSHQRPTGTGWRRDRWPNTDRQPRGDHPRSVPAQSSLCPALAEATALR